MTSFVMPTIATGFANLVSKLDGPRMWKHLEVFNRWTKYSGSPEELESNVLLGDPSLRLAIPFGPPALGLSATAAEGSVALTWDSVAAGGSSPLSRNTPDWNRRKSGSGDVGLPEVTLIVTSRELPVNVKRTKR